MPPRAVTEMYQRSKEIDVIELFMSSLLAIWVWLQPSQFFCIKYSYSCAEEKIGAIYFSERVE